MKIAIFRGLALFILGVLLGAAGTNAIIGKQVDHLLLAKATLEDALEDVQGELAKLKESSQKKPKRVITGIETFLVLTSREGLTEYDELSVRLQANERAKDWLTPLVGQEIAKLDSLWIPSVVDNREIEVNGTRYRLKTHLVVVSEKLTLYLKATPVKEPGQQ